MNLPPRLVSLGKELHTRAEVDEYPCLAVIRVHDVGLHVAMDDGQLVEVAQRVQDALCILR